MASRSWNRIELIGNLTRDPELRFTPNGAAVCTFGIATNRSYVAADGERKEDVDFHRLVAWNKLAELCNQLLKKGTKVFVSGRLQYREWETPEGQKRREAEIVLEDMIIVTSQSARSAEDISDPEASAPTPAPKKATPKAEAPKEEPKEEPKPAPADETVSDDDLPF